MDNLDEYFILILENLHNYNFIHENMLREGLAELKELIGLDNIKKNILDMLINILVNKNHEYFDKKNNIMNILITGEPGMAKTTLAKIIGKILTASGYLNKNCINSNTENNMKFINNRINCINTCIDNIIKYIPEENYDKIKDIKYELYGHIQDINSYSKTEYKEYNYIFKEVSRDEIIGRFQGHTANNVRKIFNDAKGGVIFFDEAYSIINSNNGDDDFGQECLDMINKLMLEMSGEVIVIFAGYEDKIKDLLFSRQKGLESRFLWHFKINNYNTLELCNIFLLQIKKFKFNIDFDIKYIINIIQNNNFKNYGRDTQKLLLHISTIYSIYKFKNPNINDRIITKNMLDQALSKMNYNNDYNYNLNYYI